MAQVVEHLSSKHKALVSTTKKKKKVVDSLICTFLLSVRICATNFYLTIPFTAWLKY
jgi:hypothetical protein